jgi:hypothetical protein
MLDICDGIKLHVIPYRFNIDATEIKVFEGNDYDKIMAYLSRLSGITGNEAELASYFNGWALNHKWCPKLTGDFCNLENYDAPANYNLVKCESHLSQLKTLLSVLYHDRIKETKLWAEKVKELQQIHL